MLLADVNVLVYAYREDAPGHHGYREWLESVLKSDLAYGVSDLVLSGFLRVATHPRVFDPPSPLDHAFTFTEVFRSQPQAVPISPGPRHWDIFTRLCRSAKAKGNLIPDAYLAAMAIESGSEWITADREYSRFPGLRWRHPFET